MTRSSNANRENFNLFKSNIFGDRPICPLRPLIDAKCLLLENGRKKSFYLDKWEFQNESPIGRDWGSILLGVGNGVAFMLDRRDKNVNINFRSGLSKMKIIELYNISKIIEMTN